MDGHRVLIDRLWPRGVSRDRAKLDDWKRDLAPSKELRQWFGHEPDRFDEFRRRYIAELDGRRPSAHVPPAVGAGRHAHARLRRARHRAQRRRGSRGGSAAWSAEGRDRPQGMRVVLLRRGTRVMSQSVSVPLCSGRCKRCLTMISGTTTASAVRSARCMCMRRHSTPAARRAPVGNRFAHPFVRDGASANGAPNSTRRHLDSACPERDEPAPACGVATICPASGASTKSTAANCARRADSEERGNRWKPGSTGSACSHAGRDRSTPPQWPPTCSRRRLSTAS